MATVKVYWPADIETVSRACTHKIAIVRRSRLMSALPPKADIERHDWHVRFVPKADLRTAAICSPIRSPRRRARVNDSGYGAHRNSGDEMGTTDHDPGLDS